MARRDDYVRAARKVALRDGLQNMSLRAVSKEADVLLSTLQYVFPAKQDLLNALISDIVGEIRGTLEELVWQVPGTFADKVEVALLHWWSLLVDGQENVQVMQYQLVLQGLQDPAQHETVKWIYDSYLDGLHAFLTAANKAVGGSVQDLTHETRILFALLDGLVLQYVVYRDPARARADLGRAIALHITFSLDRRRWVPR